MIHCIITLFLFFKLIMEMCCLLFIALPVQMLWGCPPPYARVFTTMCLKDSVVVLVKRMLGDFLVVQRLKICMPMRGSPVQFLVWEDSTCIEAIKLSQCPLAYGPQQGQPPISPGHCKLESSPAVHNQRQSAHSNEDPAKRSQK